MNWTQQQVDAHNARIAKGGKQFRGGGASVSSGIPCRLGSDAAAATETTAHTNNATQIGHHEFHPLDTAQNPVPEPPVRHEPVAAAEGKESHPVRFRVRVESRRVRLLDPDNLCPKYFIDCLRYAELIPDDSARYVEVQTLQTRVPTKAQEGTQVTITEIKP